MAGDPAHGAWLSVRATIGTFVNLHRLDLISLSLFSTVARCGSISKGARQAHLAVGAASKRISDLEAALGTRLLERHSRGVTLTEAGRAVRSHAGRILTDVGYLASDLADHAAGLIGVARLWANTSAVTQFLPRDVARFSAAHPGIRIEMEERFSQEIVLAVLEGRADLGIFADRTPLLGLHAQPYRTDCLVLVVPRRHPLAVRRAIDFIEAADLDFITLSSGASIAERLLQEAELLGRRLRQRIQVRSFDAMCQMVAAGLGVAVLPEAACRPHLRSMGLTRISIRDAWAQRTLLLGMREMATLPRPARLLAEHLQRP